MTKTHLHIDVETYSSEDLSNVGAYKYTESPDFEILMVAYCLDNRDIKIVDLFNESVPADLHRALTNKNVIKHAHNATFERLCFSQIGYETDPSEWRCSAILALCSGLPMSLQGCSSALRLHEEDKAKLRTGKDLIKYFCMPIKPTKVNGMRRRNLPHHNPEKWQDFMDYCIQDVVAEMAVCDKLKDYKIIDSEQHLYNVDQRINDRGLCIDNDLTEAAISIAQENKFYLINEMRKITGLDNPNSTKQLSEWLTDKLGKSVKSVAKDKIAPLLDGAPKEVVEVLRLRSMTSKTSVSKYKVFRDSTGYDGRSRGHLQFCGAMRTGRWAGRLAQVHNLPRNYIEDLDGARNDIKSMTHDELLDKYKDIPSTLSQLIRTVIVAEEGNMFAVADFSAIEARIVAWLSGEKWRMDVFETHGKIYEASAAAMMGIDIGDVTQEQRSKGKIAELALGFGGTHGAMNNMGAEKMGLSRNDITTIIEDWRKASPEIVKFWYELDTLAKRAVSTGKRQTSKNGLITFGMKRDRSLVIELPSKRQLVYREAKIGENRFGGESIVYKGVHEGAWTDLDTYGAKFLENIAQAVARDIMAETLVRLDNVGLPCVLHVHDEAIVEVPIEDVDIAVSHMCHLMSLPIPWANGLTLKGEGFTSYYYKK